MRRGAQVPVKYNGTEAIPYPQESRLRLTMTATQTMSCPRTLFPATEVVVVHCHKQKENGMQHL